MRSFVFALLVSAGAAAFGQSSPTTPFKPGNFGKFPSQWTNQGMNQAQDSGRWPQEWNSLNLREMQEIHLPAPKPANKLGDAAVDPEMIVRPTERDLGTQPKGTLVAQNLYPGLRLLPIDQGKPLTIVWPDLKMEQIPIAWPQLNMSPATVANSSGK